jgi:hypothetical protein
VEDRAVEVQVRVAAGGARRDLLPDIVHHARAHVLHHGRVGDDLSRVHRRHAGLMNRTALLQNRPQEGPDHRDEGGGHWLRIMPQLSMKAHRRR